MIHSLKTVQLLPVKIEDAWKFFSSPENLKDITPAYMGFKILSGVPVKMYPGMIISYTIKPFPFYKVNWVTEITQVEEMEYFIDSQLSGPYAIWHHEHRFREVKGGVEMTDLLYYKLPFGFLGTLVNYLFIRKKVESVFAYRTEVLKLKYPVETDFN
jgi:ligand-binding SRPBCC domain-containing protein